MVIPQLKGLQETACTTTNPAQLQVHISGFLLEQVEVSTSSSANFNDNVDSD